LLYFSIKWVRVCIVFPGNRHFRDDYTPGQGIEENQKIREIRRGIAATGTPRAKFLRGEINIRF
ncbi:MAG: hypothetical protein K8F27_09050, partial [Sulfuricellaceae bacterium]|nr:hypothetical protein [Sulfuricellaceae bacterium]